MNRVRVAAVAAIALLIASQSWAEESVLSASGETRIDGKTWLTFSGPASLKALASAPIPDGSLSRFEAVVRAVASWKAIAATEIRAVFSQDGDDYIILVSQSSSGGKDYAKNIQAGIRLHFAGALTYDFRVKSGDYFVRVHGVLMDEASLASEIAKAADDPAGYIAERDPAWAAGRVGELEAIVASASEAVDILRAALAAQLNKSFFGTPRPVQAALVETIKALKKADPTADRAAAMSAAKKGGLKANPKEIDSIFRAWFGE